MLKIATIEDVNDILDVLKHFHEESPYADEEFKPDYVRELVVDVIGKPQTSAIILAENEHGQKVGIVGATLSPMLLSGSYTATEMVWWVHPAYRAKSSVAADLLAAFEYWAKMMGAKRMSLALLAGPYEKILDRFYKQRGYRFVESSYLKEI